MESWKMTDAERVDYAVELLRAADQLLDGVAMGFRAGDLRAVAILGIQAELGDSTRRLLEVRPDLVADVVAIR